MVEQVVGHGLRVHGLRDLARIRGEEICSYLNSDENWSHACEQGDERDDGVVENGSGPAVADLADDDADSVDS